MIRNVSHVVVTKSNSVVLSGTLDDCKAFAREQAMAGVRGLTIRSASGQAAHVAMVARSETTRKVSVELSAGWTFNREALEKAVAYLEKQETLPSNIASLLIAFKAGRAMTKADLIKLQAAPSAIANSKAAVTRLVHKLA